MAILIGWTHALGAASAALPVPSRQAHLDFHTSEHIPGVGSRFSKENWQQALQVGRVNSINLFAKCHHGWSYYPTQVGRRHPTLQRDLLGEQIAASHELGVRCPIYYSVGWSAQDASQHPEWCVRNRDGSIAAHHVDFNATPEEPRPPASWVFLCPSGDYRDLILRQTDELCRLYAVDGFFYDINDAGPPCYCGNCRAGMARETVAPEDESAVAAYNARKWKRFFAEAKALIRRHHPQATVFFNGTTQLQPDCTDFALWDENTHIELEDLPTTGGGYDQFPLRSKFFHNTGWPVIAMSGKFHTGWGEFGGFKHREAMRYEAAAMIAFGASCNFGDQLHPSGEMDLETYRNLGYAYEYVERIEEYGVGGRPVSRLGLWRTGSTPDDEGVSRMLLETQNDYVVVAPEKDLRTYNVIVLTGAAGITEANAARLNDFVRNGGGLLVLGESALDATQSRFLLDVGARYLGPANYEVDYLVLGERLRLGRGEPAPAPALAGSLAGGVPVRAPGPRPAPPGARNPAAELGATPFLNYRAAIRVQSGPDSLVLARIREPYFDRTYGRYCSHRNTPYRLEDAPHPGAVLRGRVVFLPHRLGEMYFIHGARIHRQLFENALELIYTDRMLKVDLPSAGRVSLLHQPQRRRYIAHLLYAPPLQRGRAQVIEDLPAVENVVLEMRLPEAIRRTYLIPERRTLLPKRMGDVIKVTVPRFQMHGAVVFEY